MYEDVFNEFKEDYINGKLMKDGFNKYLELEDYTFDYSEREIYDEMDELGYAIKEFLENNKDGTKWICGIDFDCVVVVSKEFNETLKHPNKII